MKFFSQTPDAVQTLRECGWRTRRSPKVLDEAISMLVPDERAMLYHLGREYYRGEGIIVDAGCFLGGSTLSLGLGVQDNPKVSAGAPSIYSYDLFRVEPWAVGKHWPVGKRFRHILEAYQQRAAGESFRDLFDEQTAAVRDRIRVHEGDVCAQPAPEGPVEVLFLDILKTPAICDFMIERYFPLLVPGQSLVVQQDYLFGRRTHWIHITMEMLREYFEPIAHCRRNSVLFFYKKAIPEDLDLRGLYSRLSRDEREHWMAQAIERWTGDNRAFLESARRHMRVGTNATNIVTANLNQWCQVPDDPFSNPIALHPSIDGKPDPEVCIRNLVFAGGEGFRARVALTNESATNDVLVEFAAVRGSEVVHALEVRASAKGIAHFQAPANTGAVDLRIRIRKLHEKQPAHRCRVMIGPMLLEDPKGASATRPDNAGSVEVARDVPAPIRGNDDRGTYSITRKPTAARDAADLPIPPKELRAYDEESEQYMSAGRAVVETMIAALSRHQRPLDENERVLEFGCSSGRLLRWLLPYSESMEIWGVDIDANMITWATEHLSDHFNFAVCTPAPHLPFPDGYFDLVFAGSAFAHLEELHRAWVLELSRVLRSDGTLYALFLDEASVGTLQRERGRRLSKELQAHPAGPRVFGGDYDCLSVRANPQAPLSNVFMKRDYIERMAGPQLTLLDMIPDASADGHSAYVFRKR